MEQYRFNQVQPAESELSQFTQCVRILAAVLQDQQFRRSYLMHEVYKRITNTVLYRKRHQLLLAQTVKAPFSRSLIRSHRFISLLRNALTLHP